MLNAVYREPSKKIFTEQKERLRIFNNFDVFLENIPKDKISESIKALRNKIAQYDIMYFYDVVLSDSNKRKNSPASFYISIKTVLFIFM